MKKEAPSKASDQRAMCRRAAQVTGCATAMVPHLELATLFGISSCEIFIWNQAYV